MINQTSTVSALELIAGAGLYQNQGIIANSQFTGNVATYEATSPIANLLYTINAAATNGGLAISAGTLANLQSIGANVSGNYFPALGDCTPSNISIATANIGLVGQIVATGASYVANTCQFVQAFSAASGYVQYSNRIIFSVLSANTYLGPTYNGMTNLVTGDTAQINLAFEPFAQDLRALGQAYTLAKFGTPAALLQQLTEVGNMVNGTLPAVRDALMRQGLRLQDIADLVNNNIQSLFNPDGLTPDQFDSLQKRAYPALVEIAGTDLEDVTSILEVTTPNIETMADLLDPVKIFPNSYASLTLPTPNGDILIYNNDGQVNSQVTQILSDGSLVPIGCEQLAKIMPPNQAAAVRAIQVAFARVKNAPSLTLQQLAESLA